MVFAPVGTVLLAGAKIMSSNDATSNVIPLRAPDRPGTSEHAQQFERLLEQCRELTCERLSQSIAAMLDKAGDTLWDLRNATQDRDTQNLYMEAKEKLLQQRKFIGERFCSRYLTEFDNRAGQARTAKPSFSGYKDTALELGLVDEDDLNESLKVNEMAGKLRGYCEEELTALDQRVGVLLGDANLQADNNPFSPRAICDAFKHAGRDIEPEIRIRMVLVKLFDDHVLDDIRSIYKAVNALLVQHSILPKIRYGRARNQEGGGGGPLAADSAAALHAGAALTGSGIAVPVAEQDVFSVLQSLIATRGKAMGQPGAGLASEPGPAAASQGAVQIGDFPPIFDLPSQADGTAAQALLQGAALLSLLTRIQHGDFSQAGGGVSLPPTTEAGATNVLRELKGTSVGTGLGQMEIVTLDIMAMLFDQIFDDRKIPNAMKWLIGRLQIPMLKVAILDKTFFSTRTHPARQMLDTLGEIAVGLPADIDSSNPLYQRVETIVEKLIAGFEDSLEIFDIVRQELEEVVARENQRVEERTRSTATRLEQKERLGVAKAIAQDEVKARLQAGPMPKVVQKFLAQHWIKLLLIIYAKRGKDCEAWKRALQTMDELIASVRCKSPGELHKLAALLPGLLKRLGAGMHIVGTNEATRERFFADLMKLHTEAMGALIARSMPPVEAKANLETDARLKAAAPVAIPPGREASAASSTTADQAPAPSDATGSEPTAGDESESDVHGTTFSSR